MAYTRINWEDTPSTKTPINAENLNKMDKGIFSAHEQLDAIPDWAKNGVSPKIVVEKIEGGHGVMVTDYTGTKTFEVMDGVSATHSWNGTTLNITSASGTSSADLKGDTGKSAYEYAQDGGYTGTEEEFSEKLSTEWVNESDLEIEVTNQLESVKADIVQELINQLQGLPVFGTVNDDNTITVTSTLADGTYTLMYEYEDGTTTKIGDIIIGDGEEDSIMINLANPTSADWKLNKRINSSKNEVDIPESSLNGETMVMTNFIDISDFTNNTKLYIKGLNLLATTGVGYNYNRIYFYDETKSYKIYWQPSGQYVSNYLNVSDYNEDIQILTNIQQLMSGLSELNGVPAKYMVIGAVLTGDSEEVIISKDVQITT